MIKIKWRDEPSAIGVYMIVGILAIFVAAVIVAGCTDARMGKITALGNPAHIQCYSGGALIYDGYSTGKVSSEDSSDGYFFKDRDTGKFMMVSGNCVMTYED
jgi:hypothetical protein